MKYCLAANSYGPRDPRAAKSLMHAVLKADRRGYHLTGDLSVFGAHLILGRNRVHKAVVNDRKADYEGVVWIDSDLILPQDAIWQLLEHIDELRPSPDFISGVYFKRGDRHEPLIGEFYQQETPRGPEWWSRYRRAFGPGQGLIEIPRGACGFGLVYTSTKLLRLLPEADGYSPHAPGPFTKLPFIGEPGDDYSFCFRVGELGIPLYVDTDLMAGHLMDSQPVGFEDFVAAALEDGAIS